MSTVCDEIETIEPKRIANDRVNAFIVNPILKRSLNFMIFFQCTRQIQTEL